MKCCVSLSLSLSLCVVFFGGGPFTKETAVRAAVTGFYVGRLICKNARCAN